MACTFVSDEGSAPESWFELTSRYPKLLMDPKMSGKLPVNWLPSSSRRVRLLRLLRVEGMVLFRLQFANRKSLRAVAFANDTGTEPPNVLLEI